MSNSRIYDVAIIGSGAAGGITASVLTKQGFEVVMLEAGPLRSPAALPNHAVRRWDLPFRGLRGTYFREFYESRQFLVNDSRQPYAWDGRDPVEWTRIQAVGGKTLFWAGHVPRFGPEQFQPLDDFDTAWPITYADVEPYYDRVEEMIGVTSSGGGAGRFPANRGLPALAPKCVDVELKRAAESLGRGLKVLALPKAILTTAHDGRPACHYCGPCWLGCDSGSKFDSMRVFVLRARNTGKLTLLTGARVRSLELGSERRVTAAHYYDLASGSYRSVRAKVFVLAAGCIESTQILLNSGIANSSGVLGHYLTEHISALGVGGFLPQLTGRRVRNEDGTGMHAFIPDLTSNWRGKNFLRGYQLYFSGGINEFTLVGRNLPGFGAEWQRAIREYYTGSCSVYGQGEVLPYFGNYITVDSALADHAGIPGVRFHYSWRENERAMVRDMLGVCEEIVRKAGAEYSPPVADLRPATYGRSIHYVGTARMGNDPRTSVVNKWHQSHDVPNLFLNDGGVFVTPGSSNPTLTMLALALRATEHLAYRMKRGEV